MSKKILDLMNDVVTIRGYYGRIISVSIGNRHPTEYDCTVILQDISPWHNEITLEGVTADEIMLISI